MKRKKKLLYMLPLLGGLLLAGCGSNADSSAANSACGDDGAFGCEVGTEDSIRSLSDDFVPMTFQEAIDVFENGQDGLLYFGFPDCPWCREVVPILHEEAERLDVPVCYIRTRDDDKELLYTPEQRVEIAPYLGEFVSTGLDGELKLYVPLVVAVKNGKLVQGHQGTVDDHDAHEREMTDEEREQVDKEIREIVTQAAS